MVGIQVTPGMAPVVLCGQGHLLSGMLAVGQQVYHDAVRTLAVLVIGILPLLAYGNMGLLYLMGIGNGEAIGQRTSHLCYIAGNKNLVHSVNNQLTVFMLIQFRQRVAPIVF